MTAAIPTERVAEILQNAGYRRIEVPLEIAGLTFDIAGSFIGSGHSADLIVIVDMAANSERNTVQQIDGIARALDVMRSQRPLTTIIVGPRPASKAMESISQVSRTLAVEEAIDPDELRDRLSILLPLQLPDSLCEDRDLGNGEELQLQDNPLASVLIEASKLGEEAVRARFHTALNSIFQSDSEENGEASK